MKEVYTDIMALTQGDKNWLKKEMFDLLVDFHETVAKPTMEMIMKDGEDRIKDELGGKIDVVDLKLTKMLDHHSEKIEDHEKRITELSEQRWKVSTYNRLRRKTSPSLKIT